LKKAFFLIVAQSFLFSEVIGLDKVVHFEIPTEDLERAKKFYKNLFGWEIVPVPNMEEYAIVRTVAVDKKNMPKEKGAINGGLMKRTQPNEAPVLVIAVSNLDQYLKKVVAAGGKIVVPKQTVMDMGLYARVSDSEGNIIGLWENLKKM
jgi:predicted enzyme related to lactoylglutathione lyase